jgi:hypothetical protein
VGKRTKLAISQLSYTTTPHTQSKYGHGSSKGNAFVKIPKPQTVVEQEFDTPDIKYIVLVVTIHL